MGKSRREVLAAGAVVWRVVGRRLEVLLIHRPRYDDWSWPKGKLDSKDEPLPLCAVREVQEETGVPVLLGAKLPTVRYKLPGGAKKEIGRASCRERVEIGGGGGALENRRNVARW